MNTRRINASQSLSAIDQYKVMMSPYCISDNIFGGLSNIISTNNTSYPPYNIVKNTYETLNSNGVSTRSTEYVLSVALAGFNKNEIDVTIEKDNLVIKSVEITELEISEGDISSNPPVDVKVLVSTERLHNGISSKKFYRTFHIGNNLKLINCKFENGTLIISFEEIEKSTTSVVIE